MIAKRRTRSRRDLGVHPKPAPKLQIFTDNKLSELRIGDRVIYRDPMNRERIGSVCSVDLARGTVIALSSDGMRKQRVTVRNFLRIEARTAKNILAHDSGGPHLVRQHRSKRGR
jgi:hypothetical protein